VAIIQICSCSNHASNSPRAQAEISGSLRGRWGAIATNPGYAKLFAELGLGSLAVGIVLVVLIPFLRKLITDKAETPPAETLATVVPVA
jgi:hypothetical protein